LKQLIDKLKKDQLFGI